MNENKKPYTPTTETLGQCGPEAVGSFSRPGFCPCSLAHQWCQKCGRQMDACKAPPDTRPEFKPCGICSGQGKIYHPNEPVPYFETCHACKGACYAPLTPQTEIPILPTQEAILGDLGAWCLCRPDGKLLMAFVCETETLAWETLDVAFSVAEDDSEPYAEGAKKAGYFMRPVTITPK